MNTKVIIVIFFIFTITGCSASNSAMKPEDKILTSVIDKTSENNGPYAHLVKLRILLELGAVSEKFNHTIQFNESLAAKYVLNIDRLESILQMGSLPKNLNEIFSDAGEKNITFEKLNDGVDLILELSGQNSNVKYKFKKKDGEWLLLNHE